MCQIKRESGMRRGYNVRALFQISKYPNAQYCIHQSMKLKTNERKYQMCVRVRGVACAHALHAYWIRKKRNKYRLTTNIGEYAIHKKLNQQKLICSIYIHLTSITYKNIWLKNVYSVKAWTKTWSSNHFSKKHKTISRIVNRCSQRT